ncbi:Hypp3902 [Branchiostoma lanceolatum]|uniref:Hypp3902 protein n=1 Tax=Branchiostoma lanceolatum TaxID=7740 RepID=A0A8K0EZS3_BRALA|nr:Hypp3902 [Branchiostoma lanceolatum]
MATFAKLLGRALTLTPQVLPARRLHMAAGPGWDVITAMGKMSRQLPAEDAPTPARSAHTEALTMNGLVLKTAMEDAESLNLTDPSASALRLMEHAKAFGASAPASWCLKVRRQYGGLPAGVWTFKNGMPVNSI